MNKLFDPGVEALADSEVTREAQLALKGLDRIDVGTPAIAVYDGPRDPDALLEHFGHGKFRPGQREAVEAALAGRDSLVVMPTGGGKSLCYQLPGIASGDLTVVVSPLIALMADQYRRLALGGHPAAMVASGMDEAAVRDALQAVRMAMRASLLLAGALRRQIVPDGAFLTHGRPVRRRRGRCVSEWGHDFRPDYLRLRGVIDGLGRRP